MARLTLKIYNVSCLGKVLDWSYFLSFMDVYGGGDLIVINAFNLLSTEAKKCGKK